MHRFGRFVDDQSSRRFVHEQEGFARAIDLPPGEVLICGSMGNRCGMSISDFRGPATSNKAMIDGAAPGWTEAFGDRRAVEWETTPPEVKRDTVFTWIGGAQVRPVRPAFPYATAQLFVDGVFRFRFPLNWPMRLIVRVDGFGLYFEPRRLTTMVEFAHRAWEPPGVCGFYRLEVPAAHVQAGKPLRLRVEVDPAPEGSASIFFVSPRNDALSLSLAVLRDEVAQLQADMVQFKRSHETLYAQAYPELFPARMPGERSIVWQHELNHYHPASITVLRNGDAVITAREAADHLDVHGRMVYWRSRDGGRKWTGAKVLFDLGKSDHRSSPIFELPNGEWVTTDYRAASLYTPEGIFTKATPVGPSLWGAWSSDQGATWQFSKDPICVPGMHPFAEAERHMIQLPSGRLLVAASYAPYLADGKTVTWTWVGMAIHASDDNGRTWRCLSRVPEDPRIIGEPTLLRTRSGRIILLARSEVQMNKDFTTQGMLFQTESLDDGVTWSKPRPTEMSSMAAPGHLLQLQDGRILVSHSSRYYPGSIYVTTSEDEGRTWNTAGTRILANDLSNDDSCYPTSGQLPDGTILTTWYGNLFGKFFVAVMRYRAEDL